MLKTLKNYFYLFRYAAKYTNFIWWSIVDGFIWAIYRSFTTVVFIKYLFDMIEKEKPFGQILPIIAAMGIYMMLIYVFHEVLYNYVKPKTQQRLHEKMHTELFEKAMSLDLSCYDNPEFYNEYVWMLNQFESEVIEVADDVSKFINRILSSAIVIALIAAIDISAVCAIVFAVAVSVALKYARTKLYFNKQADLKPSERKSDYVGRVFYLSEYAQEIRMSKVADILNADFETAIDEQIKINKSYGKKLFFAGIIRDFATSILINAGIITLLAYKIMVEQSISLGDFAASIGGTWTLFWQLNNLLDYFTKLKGHSLYAERLRKFLSNEPKIKNADNARDVSAFGRLALKNISFSYPGAENEALSDIDMEIKKNEKIALVGYNGAGKSTLVKLIMRLYDPANGVMEWNGSDVKMLNLAQYRRQFGTVFQDFQIFAVSVGENVKGDIVYENDHDMIMQALEKSGFTEKLASMPNGIKTELTKEFDKDGVSLSGGEFQKIAIARAFMKNSDIIILDEPSSALDPMSEYELNKTMMSAAFDKTVIFISHRLSTTIMADRIYMLDGGRIIERGNHAELMGRNGKYAEMFRMQAEKYQDDFLYKNGEDLA
jgi:ATP-binding cassette subfamily B protein